MVRRSIVLLVCWTLSFPLAAFAQGIGLAQSVKQPDAKEANQKKAASAENDEYFELYQALADTIDQVDRNYVKEIGRRELVEAAIRGVVNRLDPYSMYISPEELSQFRTNVESEFGGIGIQVSTDDGDLRVLSPIYGAPAYRAGVLAGDRIIEIDGKSTDGLQQDEAVARMKGKEGSSISLTLLHVADKKREKVTLKREMVHVETVLGDRRKDDDTWNFMLDDAYGAGASKIGFIRITTFSRDTAEELRKALDQLRAEHARALILDLRFNPGGLLSSAIEICNMFVSEGRIVSTKGRNTPEKIYDAQGNAPFADLPIAILVNRYSASASEIVSACLQDHGRATIIGERTWGKGSVQNIIDLENGKSALKLTTAAYRRPSGKNIHRFPDSKPTDEWGVMPNDGFELPLTDREAVDLIADRRDRDILQPHKHGEKSDKMANGQASNGQARASTGQGQGLSNPDGAKPDSATPGSGSNAPATSPSNARPSGLQRRPGSSTSSTTPLLHVLREVCMETEVAKGPAIGKKPADTKMPDAKKKPFVDRQLELAVKFLKGELEKKK